MWNQHLSWEEAEKDWEARAAEAKKSHPIKKLAILPNMVGITEETSKHLQRHFAGCNEEEHLLARMSMNGFKEFLSYVMNGGDEKRNSVCFWKRMDSFAYKALAAYRII